MAEYIERDALIEAIQSLKRNLNSVIARRNLTQKDIMRVIAEFPAADVAPVVHGRWEGTADGYADGELVYDMWECSECGFDADGADEKPDWKYCPNCGAKMRGDAE